MQSIKRNSLPPKIIERIPVYIISGFLGSGKTTLLNRLLHDWPKSAVIINEFGSTPIDQQLLREHQMPLSTIAGGCLCCQVIGSLTPLLKNLRLAWENEHNTFERIIIETSGVANPEPVLDIILRERWLSKRYTLQGVITAVSAIINTDYLDSSPEAQAQIAWADTLVLTQTDLVTPEKIQALNAKLKAIAPATKCLTAVRGELDLSTILHDLPQYRKLRDTEMPNIPAHGFYSISLRLDQPMAWVHIEETLLRLLANYEHELVRVKGVVYTPNDKQPLLIQGTGSHLYPPTRLPVRVTDDGIGRLVIITHGEINALAENLMTQLAEAASKSIQLKRPSDFDQQLEITTNH